MMCIVVWVMSVLSIIAVVGVTGRRDDTGVIVLWWVHRVCAVYWIDVCESNGCISNAYVICWESYGVQSYREGGRKGMRRCGWKGCAEEKLLLNDYCLYHKQQYNYIVEMVANSVGIIIFFVIYNKIRNLIRVVGNEQ